MSLDADLLFSQSDYPQSDYFPELNNDNTAFNEADFEKDLFGPATSGLSEHSGIQAPQANYDGLVSDPLNIDDDHFLRSLQQHEELEVDSKASHSGTSNRQEGDGTKQEMHPLYANGQVNMVPVSSGPMFHYSGVSTTGGFVQQVMPPPGGRDFGTAATMERLDRLALENQHMQQYQQQQELLQAQQRQLQAQQQQLQSLQQAQLQHVLYTQNPQQPVMFLGPRPGAPYLPSPRGIPHTGPPQMVYALPGGLPVQLQPLPPGVTYHSTVAPIPLDQALTGKYFAPVVPPVQMNPPPLLMPTSVQMNSIPVHMSPRPLHISAPVSPRVSAPPTPRSPRQHGGVKLEDGSSSPTVRQGGRAPSGGGEPNSGRASPSRDRKPPRSPTVPEQHPRPPLPTSHAVYMPVQYIQGGAPQFPRVQSADLLSQVDANGDVSRPLPPMPQRGAAGAQGLSALQRSQSSHSLGQLPMGQSGPHMDARGLQRLESPAPYQMPNQGLGGMSIRQPSPIAAAGMRRVQSTGDIQSWNRGPSAQNGDGAGGAHYDDFKVGRYTVEERKMRIQRYRQKRNERNYNKKIKYVCRKTLADSRPRIRGRFAKNDEVPGFTEAKKALEEEEDDSDFDEDLIMEEGDTLLLGGTEFDVLDAQRSLATSVSAPMTLSA